jgi:hypothetical protein
MSTWLWARFQLIENHQPQRIGSHILKEVKETLEQVGVVLPEEISGGTLCSAISDAGECVAPVPGADEQYFLDERNLGLCQCGELVTPCARALIQTAAPHSSRHAC